MFWGAMHGYTRNLRQYMYTWEQLEEKQEKMTQELKISLPESTTMNDSSISALYST